MQTILKRIITNKKNFFRIHGDSMFPLLKPNSLISFKKIGFNHLLVNDLVLAEKDKHFFVHRVIYKTKKYLITRGDNNFKADGKIYPKQIAGKVYQVKRNGQVFNPESLYLLQSSLYFQEIIKIKNAFEKKKINFVFLKGLPLHLYFEKTHPRRIYADFDILVNPKYIDAINTILEREKYLISKNYLTRTHEIMKKKTTDIYYYKKIKDYYITLDLHFEVDLLTPHISSATTLYLQKYIDQLTEEFLKTKRLVKIDNEFFWILDIEYFMLYLALHLFRHNFRGAFRYQFLDTVIRKEKLTPFTVKYLTVIIKKYHLQNFVYPVFVLLKKYYHTPIPPPFLKTIKPTGFINFMNFIDFKNLNIFDDEPRIKAGINRFKNLFLLSPNPFWKKLLVFFNFQVLYSVFWVLWRRLFSFFRIFFKPNSSFFK